MQPSSRYWLSLFFLKMRISREAMRVWTRRIMLGQASQSQVRQFSALLESVQSSSRIFFMYCSRMGRAPKSSFIYSEISIRFKHVSYMSQMWLTTALSARMKFSLAWIICMYFSILTLKLSLMSSQKASLSLGESSIRSQASSNILAARSEHLPSQQRSQMMRLNSLRILYLSSQNICQGLRPEYSFRESYLRGLFTKQRLFTFFQFAIARFLFASSCQNCSFTYFASFILQFWYSLSRIGGTSIICMYLTSGPQVVPLMSNVSEAIPDIQKRVSSLNRSFQSQLSTQTIRARLRPRAPLSPPQTSTTNSLFERGQPKLFSTGVNVPTITRRITCIKNQKRIIFIQSADVIECSYRIFTPIITPVSRKIMVSQAYCTNDQTTCRLCSDYGQMFVLPMADKYNPKTTRERMPDTPSPENQAKQKEMKQAKNVTQVVSTQSLMILFITKAAMTPTMIPSTGPPIAMRKKLRPTAPGVEVLPFTISAKSLQNTIAVPSFSRDYPSIRVLNLVLAPSSLRRATTATGSVADRTEPRVKAQYQVISSSEQPSRNLMEKPRRMAPQSTPGPARTKIFTKDLLKMYQSQLNPLQKISTGMKINSRRWGFMFATITVPSPSCPNASLKYPKKSPTASSCGVQGNLVRLLTSLRRAPMKRPKTTKRTTKMGPSSLLSYQLIYKYQEDQRGLDLFLLTLMALKIRNPSRPTPSTPAPTFFTLPIYLSSCSSSPSFSVQKSAKICYFVGRVDCFLYLSQASLSSEESTRYASLTSLNFSRCQGFLSGWNYRASRWKARWMSAEWAWEGRPRMLQQLSLGLQHFLKRVLSNTHWYQIKIEGKNIPRRSYHSCVHYHGRLVIFGGYYTNSGILSDLYRLDLAQSHVQFEQLYPEGELPGPRQSHSCVINKNQKIIFGGKVNSFDNCNHVHSLDLDRMIWTKVETLNTPSPIDGHSACLWGQKMIVFGGYFGGTLGKFSSSVLALDLQTKTWECMFDSLSKNHQQAFPCPRSYSGATIIEDTLFVFGGTNIDEKFGDLWAFDLVSREWSSVEQQNAPESRNGHSLLSYNGGILLFGGIHDLTHEKNDLVVFKNGDWVVLEMDTSHSKDQKNDKKTAKQSKAHQLESRSMNNRTEQIQSQRLQKYVQLKDSKILKQTLGHMSKQKEKKSKNTIKKLNILAQFELTPEQRQKFTPPSPTIEALKSSIAAIGGTNDKKKKLQLQEKIPYDATKAGRKIKRKPCARDGHSGVIAGNTLYIFGGDRHMMGFNDLYSIDLSVFGVLK